MSSEPSGSLDDVLTPLARACMARAELHAPSLNAWERLASELPDHEKQLAHEAARILRVAAPERTLEAERAFLLRAGFSAALLDDAMVARVMTMLRARAEDTRSIAEFIRSQPALAMAQALYAESRRPERATFAEAIRSYRFAPLKRPSPEPITSLEETAHRVMDALTQLVAAYALTVRATLHVTRIVDWAIPRLCAVDPTPPEDPITLLREARRAWDNDARRPLLDLLLDAEVQFAEAWRRGLVTIDAEGLHIDDADDPEMEHVIPHLATMVAHLELSSRHIGIVHALDLDPRLAES